MPIDYTEKRSFIRMQTDSPIAFREIGTEQTHHGKCINLSAVGVLFEAEHRVSPGTRMQIDITPTIEVVQPLQATIEVVRTLDQDGHYAIAGAITEIHH